ncbi:MAG: hypothetical protein KC649_05120, partial [Candidatus Omnitrophica bacterium]|nr:hypothetical protein [Candidatus Omnitrophota bacterium]
MIRQKQCTPVKFLSALVASLFLVQTISIDLALAVQTTFMNDDQEQPDLARHESWNNFLNDNRQQVLDLINNQYDNKQDEAKPVDDPADTTFENPFPADWQLTGPIADWKLNDDGFIEMKMDTDIKLLVDPDELVELVSPEYDYDPKQIKGSDFSDFMEEAKEKHGSFFRLAIGPGSNSQVKELESGVFQIEGAIHIEEIRPRKNYDNGDHIEGVITGVELTEGETNKGRINILGIGWVSWEEVFESDATVDRKATLDTGVDQNVTLALIKNWFERNEAAGLVSWLSSSGIADVEAEGDDATKGLFRGTSDIQLTTQTVSVFSRTGQVESIDADKKMLVINGQEIYVNQNWLTTIDMNGFEISFETFAELFNQYNGKKSPDGEVIHFYVNTDWFYLPGERFVNESDTSIKKVTGIQIRIATNVLPNYDELTAKERMVSDFWNYETDRVDLLSEHMDRWSAEWQKYYQQYYLVQTIDGYERANQYVDMEHYFEQEMWIGFNQIIIKEVFDNTYELSRETAKNGRYNDNTCKFNGYETCPAGWTGPTDWDYVKWLDFTRDGMINNDGMMLSFAKYRFLPYFDFAYVQISQLMNMLN